MCNLDGYYDEEKPPVRGKSATQHSEECHMSVDVASLQKVPVK